MAAWGLVFLIGAALAQTPCTPCVTVDPLVPGQPDQLSGDYRFLSLDPDCPGGCSYFRADQADQVYCFGQGPRTGALACQATGESTIAAATTPSPGPSTTAGPASQPVATTPAPTGSTAPPAATTSSAEPPSTVQSTAPATTSAASTSAASTSTASTTPSCPVFPGAERCPPGWTQHHLKCFQLQSPSPPYIWSKAKTACEELYPGGHLASVESKCENEFVFGLLGTSTVTWLGADDLDPEGTWQWIKPGGATFWQGAEAAKGGVAVAGKYANFNSAEPNNGGTGQDCLVMTEAGEWRDQLCSKSGRFLCETPATVGGETNTPPTTIAPTTVACKEACGAGWTEAGSCQCYRLNTDKLDWAGAKTACQAYKAEASLVSLTSKAVEDLIYTSLLGGIQATVEEMDYWTGGKDVLSKNTEFTWDLSSAVFWRRDTAKETHCCGVSGHYQNWYQLSDTVIMPNHYNSPDKDWQDCVKMKFILSSASPPALEKAGWDDVKCVDKALKSVCQYSVLP